MSKLSLMCALATAIAVLPCAARADEYSYTFTGNDGVVATGTLTGTADATIAGAFDITGGTINLSGAPACNNCGLSGPLDGDGVFVVNPEAGVFYTGGGTELILTGTDSLLYPDASQLIDNTGIFLFQMDSGLGVALFSNEPSGPGYGAFGGNWTLNDTGDLDATLVPTPEPTSLMLIGTGLLSAAGMARRRRRLS